MSRESANTIVILSGAHLCHNPRVVKEATALAGAGFKVEVVGAWFDAALKAKDRELLESVSFRYTPALDLTPKHAAALLRRQLCRVQTKMGHLAYRLARLSNSWQLGCIAPSLVRAAGRRQADLYIAHSDVALVAALRLLDSGRRVGIDMEDWFSEDLLPEARRQRPIGLLREAERKLLRQSSYSTCPSNSMSEELARTYDCKPPAVVHNSFKWSDREAIDGAFKDRRDRRVPSIHWFSQTLGPGRGLEDLLASLAHVERVAEIHVRGKPVAGFDAWLSERIPHGWRDRVFVHPLIGNNELLSRISEHDIGFAGEMKFCKSRQLTITNKILHYLLGGLAIIASDTAGQREVAEQAPGAVLIYPAGDTAALAAHINTLLGSGEAMKRAKAAALRAARLVFCWERQEGKLVDAVTRALA